MPYQKTGVPAVTILAILYFIDPERGKTVNSAKKENIGEAA